MARMQNDTAGQPRLADYVRPIWLRKWLILPAVLVATFGVFTYYSSQAKVYSSGTLVYVKDPGDPVSGAQNLQSTDRSVQNQASLLYSRDSAAIVARKIAFNGTADELLKRVSITSRPGEDFVTIGAEGSSGQEAATIANAYAHEFVAYINDAQTSRLRRALDLSREQLRAVPAGPANQVTRANLGDQIRRLDLALQVPATVARQVDPALAPQAPTTPKPLRNALFALVLSLVLAVAVAFGLERFDRRVKRPEEIADLYLSPLLAVLPRTSDVAPIREGGAALSKDLRESFRVLRTNVDLAQLDRPARTIVVTSANAGEGKSTVVRNLALAYRETGKRVAVVEGDLRHPSLAPLFGIQRGRGLTEVLRRDAELADVTVQIDAALPGFEELAWLDADRSAPHAYGNGNGNGHGEGNGNGHPPRNGNGHGRGNGGTVTMLLSGAPPANPPAVLASARMTEVLDALRLRHDVVLIDSAPLLAVTDTVPLLRYADAAILVSRLGMTTRDAARRVAEFLERIPDANAVGVVANDLSHFDAVGYGYGYGYEADERPRRGRGVTRRARARQTA
jgi:Mrp family chromosome partitioning ATPase/capsular polysaccharide biosynthesis protein